MTEADKLACAERELKYRQRVYPRLIDSGRLTPKRAEYEIAAMTAIVEDYRKICEGTRLI